MSLHKEIHFEVEIAEHLGQHGWVYEEGVSAQLRPDAALFPRGCDRVGAGIAAGGVAGIGQRTRPWSRYPPARPTPAEPDTRGTLDVLRNGIELFR